MIEESIFVFVQILVNDDEMGSRCMPWYIPRGCINKEGPNRKLVAYFDLELSSGNNRGVV